MSKKEEIIKIDLDEDEDKKIEIDNDNIFSNKKEKDIREEIEEINRRLDFFDKEVVPRVHLIIKNINGLQDYLKDKLSILKERNLLEFIEEEINKSLKIKIKEFEEEILKKIKDIKNIKNLKIKCEKEEEDNNKEEINENPRILRPINFFFKSINKEEMEKLFDNINKKKQIEKLILV